MELLSFLHLLEVNLTSFPPKCFFQKNDIEKFKTVSNGFFPASLMFGKKSMQQLAIEKQSIILRSDVPFGEFRLKIVFLPKNK